MNDRLESVVVRSHGSSAQTSNLVNFSNTETIQKISAVSGIGCGSADCACYGDNGCADVDNGGGDVD